MFQSTNSQFFLISPWAGRGGRVK